MQGDPEHRVTQFQGREALGSLFVNTSIFGWFCLTYQGQVEASRTHVNRGRPTLAQSAGTSFFHMNAWQKISVLKGLLTVQFSQSILFQQVMKYF